MNTMLEKNIETINDEYFKTLLTYKTDDRAKFVKSKKDEDILTFVDDNGKEIYLNSRYNAESEAQTWAEAIENKGSKLYIMYGLGNGMCLKALLERISDTSVVVIYEPFIDIAYKMLSKVDLLDIIDNPNVVLYVRGVNEFQFVSMVTVSFNADSISNAVYLQHPKYKNLSEIAYKEYKDYEKNVYTSILANQQFFDKYSEKMIRTINNNMQYLKEYRAIDQYNGAFDEDITGILVGAGPSLANNIELLKEIKGKAIIGATDTSVKKILEHGIEPDFFASIDINKVTDVFDESIANIPLVMDMTSRIELVNTQKSTKIVTGNDGEILKNIYKKFDIPLTVAPTGGSVSCTVYSAFRLWNVNRIVLIGQDFAFTGGKRHIPGVIAGEDRLVNDSPLWVEDVNGNMVETRYDYHKYLTWFESEIASEPNIEVIDATEGGAKIKGTKIMTLREVIDTYLKDREVVDYEQMIKDMPPALSNENFIKAKDMLNEKLQQLDRLVKETERGIKIQKDLKRKIKKDNLTSQEFAKENAKMQVITDYVSNYEDMSTLKRYMKEFEDILVKITTDDNPITIIDESIEQLQKINMAAKEYRVDMKKIIESV